MGGAPLTAVGLREREAGGATSPAPGERCERLWNTDPPTCYAALLDELVAAIDGSGPPPALDVTRGLRLQELVEAVRGAVG